MNRVYEVPRMRTLQESEVAASLGPVMLSAVDVDLGPLRYVGARDVGEHGSAVAGGGGSTDLQSGAGSASAPTHRRGQP